MIRSNDTYEDETWSSDDDSQQKATKKRKRLQTGIQCMFIDVLEVYDASKGLYAKPDQTVYDSDGESTNRGKRSARKGTKTPPRKQGTICHDSDESAPPSKSRKSKPKKQGMT